MEKAKKIALWSTVLCFVVALILGTIFDLQISKALADLSWGQYYTTNFYAIAGEVVGEMVLYAIVICSFAILIDYFFVRNANKKWFYYASIAIFAILSIGIGFYAINKFLEYLSRFGVDNAGKFISSTIGKIVLGLISSAETLVACLLFSKCKEETLKQLAVWAIVAILVAIASNAMVQIYKRIADRTRFRAMVYEGVENFEYYTPWYVINHNKFSSTASFAGDFFKSFPSGHACASASVFSLVLLPNCLEKANTTKCKAIFITFAISWTALVCMSRIVAGAHYFTDVLIGSFTTIFLTFLAKWALLNKNIPQKWIGKI
jgi:membrane-associated phospholipid phosphatase